MLRFQGLAFIGIDDPCLATEHLFEGEVGGIASIAEGEHVAGVIADLREQRIEGDALPLRVQVRPLGHAVDVPGHCLAWQGLKFLPGPAFGLIALPQKREIPGRQRRMRRRPCREDGKAAFEILSRWDSSAEVALLATTSEPSREETFTHCLTS